MKKQLMDVVQRGPLATIDELEKDLIWRFRFDRFYYHLDRSIPVTVHCEGTVEAISMGFEHCTSSALNFTLNSASRLFCPRTHSRGCVNAHARQLIGERERSQLDVYTHTEAWLRYSRILQAMQSSVGTSAKCIATMMHYLTISWVAPQMLHFT